MLSVWWVADIHDIGGFPTQSPLGENGCLDAGDLVAVHALALESYHLRIASHLTKDVQLPKMR